MREHITQVAFDNMDRDSITGAWLFAEGRTRELGTIPDEAKPFRHLVRQILADGPARTC